MIYLLNGQPVRRSKALAHAIDGMARNHHTDAAGYFATADNATPTAERDFARQVLIDDSGVSFQESTS